MYNERNNKRTAVFAVMLLSLLLLTGCGRIADLFLVNSYDSDAAMDSMRESLEKGEQEEADSKDAGQGEDGQNGMGGAAETDKAGRKTYLTMLVEDYEIALRDGAGEESLELWLYRNGEEWLVETYESSGGYQRPKDFTAEVFENVLGHNGFRIFTRYPLGTSSYYYGVNYYAMEEEPIHLAHHWGTMDGGVYQADVDGDGINEMICNVQWMADGAEDVIIYHFDGEKVLEGYGSDLLQEEFEYMGLGSIGAEYLPVEGRVRVWYWKSEKGGYEEREYDVELDKIEMYEYQE